MCEFVYEIEVLSFVPTGQYDSRIVIEIEVLSFVPTGQYHSRLRLDPMYVTLFVPRLVRSFVSILKANDVSYMRLWLLLPCLKKGKTLMELERNCHRMFDVCNM